MKKLATAGLCLMAILSASAQKTVVKDAETAMKGGKPYAEVLQIITPAFTNPETAKSAMTYYIPGKAGIKEYNDLLGKRQLQIKFPEGGEYVMAKALVGAYDNYMQALPLDSLPDEKGRVKPKYSKEIINDLAGHYNDFTNIAVDFWNAKDYAGAYRAWEIYLDMPNNPIFAKSIKAPADTMQSEIAYNQALAAWQADDYGKALGAFRRAKNMGYSKKGLYDYAIAVAQSAKDTDALIEFASAGNDLYGKEDIQYLNQIINYYLQTEKYDDAIAFLNQGIAENGGNAQYYALRGIIRDNQLKPEEARADYQAAYDIDNDNPLALFYLGRSIAAEAGKLADEYTRADFDVYKANVLTPKYRQAIDLLEKAYTLDQANRNEILKVLDIVYYQIDDAEGLKSVADRRSANDE